jgi:hypothetical protein
MKPWSPPVKACFGGPVTLLSSSFALFSILAPDGEFRK